MSGGAQAEPAVMDRRRTRRAMGVSLVAHGVLIVLLLTVRTAAPRPALTEIQWFEPGEGAPAEPAAGGPAPRERRAPSQAVAGAMAGEEERFRRTEREADFTPEPQSDVAIEDRMRTRLAAMQGSPSPVAVQAEGVGVPGGMLTAPAGIQAGAGGGGRALDLRRAGAGSGGTLPLLRGTGGTGSGRALTPALPAAAKAPPAPAQEAGRVTARRVLAGVSLLGPVADRPIVHFVTPAYPEWAKSEGVEAVVTLYFVVAADGRVRENVLVQKTGGFEDFDENARSALRAWRFEPLGAGRTGEQWGTITFRYHLRDTN